MSTATRKRETKQQRIDREFREAMRQLLLQLGRAARRRDAAETRTNN